MLLPTFQPAAPTARAWQGYKKSATQFGDKKNAPGIDYPSKINETHQKPLLIEESDNIPCDASVDALGAYSDATEREQGNDTTAS